LRIDNTRGIDYPGFRFVPWCILDDKTQAQAQAMYYTSDTWNVAGTNLIEEKSFYAILEESATANDDVADMMLSMGWEESTYDCYVNHYVGYDWDELVSETETLIYWEVLGWTNASWDGEADPPDSEDKEWDELEFIEQQAAIALCYFKELWSSTEISQWPEYGSSFTCPTTGTTAATGSVPVVGVFDNVTATTLELEYVPTPLANETLTNITFNDTYVTINGHLTSATLNGTLIGNDTVANGTGTIVNGTLVLPDMAEFSLLNNTPETVNDVVSSYTSSSGVSISTVDILNTRGPTTAPSSSPTFSPTRPPYIPNPANRFLLWKWLFEASKTAAKTLGYTEETWNQPMSASIESLVFDDLNPNLQDATYVLGLGPGKIWDCHVNHYQAYNWEELKTLALKQDLYIALGWSFESWNALADPPATDSKKWNELSAAEQSAATELCYRQETWDRLNLKEWV